MIEVDLEYPKELHELHNDYSLAPDKIEIKRKMLSSYQLKIADFCNIYIRIQSITMVKTIYWIQNTKKNRSRKKLETKMEKDCKKLMNNAAYRKTMENLRNRTNVRLVSNKKVYIAQGIRQ